MTGTLAALGDAIFPVANLKNALVQDFSSNSDVLLRLRTLHPVVAAVAVLYVLWMVRKLWKNREATLRHLSLPYGDIAGAGCSRRVERTPAGPVCLQLTHLLVAETVWILLVLASADLSFYDKTVRPAPLLARKEADSPAPSDPRVFAGALAAAGRHHRNPTDAGGSKDADDAAGHPMFTRSELQC
jgi:hypothetical protein